MGNNTMSIICTTGLSNILWSNTLMNHHVIIHTLNAILQCMPPLSCRNSKPINDLWMLDSLAKLSHFTLERRSGTYVPTLTHFLYRAMITILALSLDDTTAHGLPTTIAENTGIPNSTVYYWVVPLNRLQITSSLKCRLRYIEHPRWVHFGVPVEDLARSCSSFSLHKTNDTCQIQYILSIISPYHPLSILTGIRYL